MKCLFSIVLLTLFCSLSFANNSLKENVNTFQEISNQEQFQTPKENGELFNDCELTGMAILDHMMDEEGASFSEAHAVYKGFVNWCESGSLYWSIVT